MQRNVTKTREVITGHEPKRLDDMEWGVTKLVPSASWNLDSAISREEPDLSFLSNKAEHVFPVCLNLHRELGEWQTPCTEWQLITLLSLQLNWLTTFKSLEGITLKFSLQTSNLFEGSWQLADQPWSASEWAAHSPISPNIYPAPVSTWYRIGRCSQRDFIQAQTFLSILRCLPIWPKSLLACCLLMLSEVTHSQLLSSK